VQQRSVLVFDGVDIIDTTCSYKRTHERTAAWKSSSNTVTSFRRHHDTTHDGCQWSIDRCIIRTN
jgi:hypothetical protein